MYDDKTIKVIVEAGFDPIYGARPLKRAVQKLIENPISNLIIESKVKPTDAIKITVEKDNLVFNIEKTELQPVRSMTVFPEFEDGEIKLGRVSFERRDFLRSVVVGVAPFFVGAAALFFMLSSNIFFEFNLALKMLFLYLVFSISSNMFSSKADLRDLALILPVILLVAIVFYVLGIDVNAVLMKGNFQTVFNDIMNKINRYFLFVFLINFGLFVVVKTVNRFLSK